MSRAGTDLLGKELAAERWSGFFDHLTSQVQQGADLELTIQVISDPAAGSEAEHMPLESITWEDEDDVIAVGVGGRGERYPAVLWHFVERPARIWVRHYDNGTSEVTIQSQDQSTITVLRVLPDSASLRRSA